MVILALDAALLVGATSHAEVDALVLAFSHGDPLVQAGLLLGGIQRLDVHELEQFHRVQPPL